MKREATSKEKFFWNMMGAFANALSSVILSIAVNQILGGNSGGVFALAYANAQLMLTIGQFEVRQFQVTDVVSKYSFAVYHRFRMLTCLAMMLGTGGYILLESESLTLEGKYVVLALSIYKMIEAYADVYAGWFQKKDRIDISGKLFFIRITVSTIVFITTLCLFRNLVLSSLLMPVVSFSVLFLADFWYAGKMMTEKGETSFRELGRLFRDVFPLFLQAFSLMYISNAPKYAIAHFYSPEIQNIYNILFMPSFTINLVAIFIYLPMLLNIANCWNNMELAKFRRLILIVALLILLFSVIILAGTWVLGIPVLSVLYNVDLAAQRHDLFFAMGAGCLGAFASLMYNVITAMRYHKWLICGYGTAAVCALCAARPLVKNFGIHGGIIAYALSMTLLTVIYFTVFICAYSTRKGKRP